MARERNKPYPSKAFHGRGIVLVAGNSDTYQRALTAIYLLRHYKCTLPVEIWHMDDEAPTLAMKQQLKSLNAVARDLTDAKLIRPAQRRTGNSKQFQIKPAAIINSEFEQVLYLDSDNVPTGDPSFLFETPEYKTGGALFWPDYWKTNADNAIFKVLDIDCDDEWEQESGQMVIHKKKAWHALQLAWFMNHHHGIYYQFLNGDKDTFRFAWKTLGQSYYMNPVFLAMAGTEEVTGDFSVTERPWRAIKQYTNSKGQTWLQPRFYVSYEGRACMDFSTANGEPATEVLDFDQVLPEFQHLYFEFGGIGGETRL
ncbi:mannosyltransferase putative-domain-containing protein [Gongronella butleri]|nr:mannosyltransferase putative-domain-containing protein [Gongronella butleri]